MPTLGTTLGTILQNQKGTLTGRLRVRAVRLAARKWYDAGGRWNPPSGAGSDTYCDGIEERMTLFGKYEKQEGFFSKLKAAVASTKSNLVARIEDVVKGKKVIDAELLEDLEAVLIGADIGAQTTSEILEKIRGQVNRKQVNDPEQLRTLIKGELRQIIEASNQVTRRATANGTQVLMVVGVNGVGKTTTIGKLANLHSQEGKKVLVCAADTFRAAAIEQLEIWGQRAGVAVIRQKTGADPSAVLFDAIAAAKSRAIDILIVDTAGRLHTKNNLMAELEKMKRIAGREIAGAPHEVLLVIDATTGQNGLPQAREFTRTAGVTGIILTKLDGTAKGGIVIPISRELKIPIRYVGVGEKVDDLLEFSAEQYIESLFESE
jgi:fused signal recognition particle receptor